MFKSVEKSPSLRWKNGKVSSWTDKRGNPWVAAYLKINSRASAWQAAVCNNVQQLEALYHWPFANRNGMNDSTRRTGFENAVRMIASADRWLSWDGMRTINCKTSSQSGRERERKRERTCHLPSTFRKINRGSVGKKRRRNGRQWAGQTRLIWKEIGRPTPLTPLSLRSEC